MEEYEKPESPKDYLKGIINNTRLSRIEAERRLIEDDKLAKHATVYYACLTTVLTLLTVFSNAPYLPFISVASSITLTLATIYAGSQDYQSRAEGMRRCYIKLQALSFDLDCILAENPEDIEEKTLEIGRQYANILADYENHLSKDFAKVEKQKKAKEPGHKNRARAIRLRSCDYYGIRAAVYVGPYLLFGVLVALFQVA